MKYPVYLVFSMVLTMVPPLYAAEGGSPGGGISQQQSMKKLTPEEKAAVSYRQGLKHRDRAAKFEQKALNENNEKKLARLQKKISKEYERAIADFEKSIGYYPQFYEVHSSLGYTLRKIGLYDNSLAAYNESLRINPNYYEAIEYRGEAYLGLNQIGQAKTAYMNLFQNDRPLADQLMAAMISWVAARRDDAGAVDVTVVEQFATWVEQRNKLTSYVHPLDDTARGHWVRSD